MAPSKALLAVPVAGLALAVDEDAERLADVEVGPVDPGAGVAADEEREADAGSGIDRRLKGSPARVDDGSVPGRGAVCA